MSKRRICTRCFVPLTKDDPEPHTHGNQEDCLAYLREALGKAAKIERRKIVAYLRKDALEMFDDGSPRQELLLERIDWTRRGLHDEPRTTARPKKDRKR